MNSVWIFAKNDAPSALLAKSFLEKALQKESIEILPQFSKDCSLVICLGGDGSLLATLRKMGPTRFQIPVLSIHASRGLGFLHPIALPENSQALENWANELVKSLISRQYRIRQRWGLQISGPASTLFTVTPDDPDPSWALNDLVLSKGPLSRMVNFKIGIHQTVLWQNLKGDGLIVSSAVGSTAYSLAAGGPVVHPDTGALVLTPICPNALTGRPLVLDGSAEIEISVNTKSNPAYMTRDGQVGVELEPETKVIVSRAQKPLQTIVPNSPHLQSKNYFQRLQIKLGLGKEDSI